MSEVPNEYLRALQKWYLCINTDDFRDALDFIAAMDLPDKENETVTDDITITVSLADLDLFFDWRKANGIKSCTTDDALPLEVSDALARILAAIPKPRVRPTGEAVQAYSDIEDKRRWAIDIPTPEILQGLYEGGLLDEKWMTSDE